MIMKREDVEESLKKLVPKVLDYRITKGEESKNLKFKLGNVWYDDFLKILVLTYREVGEDD